MKDKNENDARQRHDSYLVVQQLLLHGGPQIDVLVQEEMLLEQEHVVSTLTG